MIKAVTFDFWGTLYDDTRELSRGRSARRVEMLQPVLAELGLDWDADRVRSALDTTSGWVGQLWFYQHCSPAVEELGAHVSVQLGQKVTGEQATLIANVISDAVIECPPVLKPGAREVLEELGPRLACGIISDTGMSRGGSLRQVLRQDGLLEHLGATTFSDETLTTKPAERQFLGTLMALDARPEQAAHVGDLERTDVTGAKAAGMWAVRIEGGFETETPPEESGADAVIHSLLELPALLDAWN